MDRGRRQLLASMVATPLAAAFSSLALGRVGDTAGPASGPGHDLTLAPGGGETPSSPLRYGGASPVPILRVGRGIEARITLRNGLAQPTSLDLHGLRVAPPLDPRGPLGGVVAAGRSAEIRFTPPDSGTFWLHPWVLDQRQDFVAAGLVGVLVVDEVAPPDVDADWVVVLSEPVPAPGGNDDGLRAMVAGLLQTEQESAPPRQVVRPGSRIRLRILNASTRRALTASLVGALPRIVAIDGQPCPLLTPRDNALPLGPGARADLVFDCPGSAETDVRLTVGASRGSTPAVALVVRTEGEARAARGPIAALAPNPLLPDAIALEAATRATLSVDWVEAAPDRKPRWTVNGGQGFELPKRPLFSTRRGTPVVLTFRNASPQLVGFRLHGFCMRLLHDLDDGWQPYWCDSLMVPPRTTHHAAFLADLPGRWLIESPFFAQAAGGVRAWFEVT